LKAKVLLQATNLAFQGLASIRSILTGRATFGNGLSVPPEARLCQGQEVANAGMKSRHLFARIACTVNVNFVFALGPKASIAPCLGHVLTMKIYLRMAASDTSNFGQPNGRSHNASPLNNTYFPLQSGPIGYVYSLAHPINFIGTIKTITRDIVVVASRAAPPRNYS
jgi:hypothetical protein